MAGQFSIQFGIEIELLIGSRSKNHKTWKSFATEVSNKLIKAGLPNHLNESSDKSLESYEEWSIVQEVTVPTNPGKNLWGLELVSPIFSASYPWNTHLTLLFKTLKSSFIISPSTNTSTHIHLSTIPPLPTYSLVSLAKAILYFEPALDALLPSSRASSYWCQSNRSNAALKHLTLPQAFTQLDYCASVTDVVRTMCLYPANSAYGRANGFTEDFVHGVYKWDFSGLDPSTLSALGTLEFRQCPGSRSAEEASTWVELAVGFVAGALEGGGGAMMDPEMEGQVGMEELWWVVAGGIQSTGIGGFEGVERLFGAGGQGGKIGKSSGKGKGKSRK